MADFPGVFNEAQKRTLTLLRLIWAVLAAEVVALGVVVYLILADRQGGGATPTDADDSRLLIVSLIAVILGGAIGYFLRMQAYKKRWVGNRIEREGYFAGNLFLFAFVEIGALVAVVCAYLADGSGRELMPLLVSLIMLALNFPNGRPMLADAGQLPDNLIR